jgi:hypothetical protein
MILHDQLPNFPKKYRQNGKTACSHTKEIVQNCLQQKTLNELIRVEIKTM